MAPSGALVDGQGALADPAQTVHRLHHNLGAAAGAQCRVQPCQVTGPPTSRVVLFGIWPLTLSTSFG